MRTACTLIIVCALANVARADKQQAETSYRRASQHYDLGEYAQALDDFKEAYRNFEDPSFLYNIAQCYRQLNDKPAAVRAYRTFLIKVPDSPNRDAVEAMIAKLSKAIDEEQALRAGPPQGVQPETSPPTANTASPAIVAAAPIDERHDRARKKTLAGIAVGSAGVAVIVGGIVCGALAQQAGNDLSRINQQMGVFDPSKESAGRSEQIAEGVLLGVGGAAVVTGVVLLVLGRRDSRAARLVLR
jgi:tetratricopeptide (TPR) repeat protein